MSKTIGKLREYETVLIISPDLTDDVANELIERFKGIIDAKGGTFLREDRWGKRKMAYDMRKNPRGHYVLLHYVGEKAVVDEIQRTSRNVDTVIRNHTTLHGPVKDIEAKKAEVEKLIRERNAEKARQEAARAEAEAAERAEAEAEAPQA
mgnify:CR=1 FL=1